MSHWTSVDTKIKDIEALKKAVEALGLTMVENSICRGWLAEKWAASGDKHWDPGIRDMSQARNNFPCDYVIKLNQGYDVGFRKEEDGSYKMYYDYYEGKVERELGKGCGKLVQEYSAQVVGQAAKTKGYKVNRQMQADGSMKLTLTGRF